MKESIQEASFMETGIELDSSNNNTLRGNMVNSNIDYGIAIHYSNNNRLIGNNVSNTLRDCGIAVSSSNNNTFSSNTINSNIYDGIRIEASSNNTFSDNIVSNNEYLGIVLFSSSNNNTLRGNNISNNQVGVFIQLSRTNLIHNNIFNNINNVYNEDSNNFWNTSQTLQTNIIGGPYLGGNFWAYPNGTGFSQTCIDNNNDGICDLSYAPDNNSTDYLPLVYKNTPVSPSNNGGGGSGSSSGGGGGGGGGTSGENFSNIIVKEKHDMHIFKDKITSYAFTHERIPILYVNITGNVSAGEINTAVEVLRNTSTLVKSSAPGIVYKNINIWVGTSGFAVQKNIKEGIIRFRVETSWLNDNNLIGNNIELVKWDGSKWIELETTEKIKDGMFTYFESKTYSFSHFAITGMKSEEKTVAVSAIQTTETPGPTVTLTSAQSRGTPGFEVIIAIAVLSAVYMLRRKRNIK